MHNAPTSADTDTFTAARVDEGAPPLASPVHFARADGSRVPYGVFSSQAVYDREQERIYRGPTWNFLGLDCEIPRVGDFKSTFVGDTPVVVTRTADGLACWVNRCAHRGAVVCREKRGNAASHTCVYHQWSYTPKGELQGVPFRRGQKGQAGMPKDFRPQDNGLRTLRVETYKGLLFATFDHAMQPLADYLGAEMRPWIDRLFAKPIVYLGCTRQFSKSNWKLYLENVKDPYHASLLHMFHTTFNIFRVGMKARSIADATHGLHSIITATKVEDTTDTAAAYSAQNIRSMDDGFSLEDPELLGQIKEFDELTTNHIQPIFPQLVIQQIHNTLVCRQLLPKGPSNFELVFHFFGYEDDTPEMRELRLLQANLVGPAGYISMEDTEATELVQRGTFRDADASSILEMGRDAPEQSDTLITENLIRRFWVGYQQLMGIEMNEALHMWVELCELQHRYVNALDSDRLEDWVEFFTEDCRYEIIPKENVDMGLPAPVIYCRNRAMLRDRVLSLRHANIFEGHTYRHMTSGLVVESVDGEVVKTKSSYLVVITGQEGASSVYQAGCYHDEVVRVDGVWRYRGKRVVYDTLRVQTLLATPI